MCPTHTGEPLVGCAAFAGLRLAGCCLPLPKSTQIKMPQPLLTVSTLTYGCRALEGGATWRQRVRPRSTQAAPWAAATLAAAATVQQCPAHSALHARGLALGLLYHTLKLQNMCNTLKIKCGIEAPATAGLPMRCGGAGSCAPYACAAASWLSASLGGSGSVLLRTHKRAPLPIHEFCAAWAAPPSYVVEHSLDHQTRPPARPAAVGRLPRQLPLARRRRCACGEL